MILQTNLPPPPPSRGKVQAHAGRGRCDGLLRLNSAGFSIVGMMVASALGITILTGTIQLFVEMSQKINRIEKRQQKQLFYAYIRKHFESPENCKLTLNAKKGTGSTQYYYAAADAANKDLDGDSSTPDDHKYKIGNLLLPDNTNTPADADSLPDIEFSFYPATGATEAQKADLKSRYRHKWGIDDFVGVTYVHDTTNGPYISIDTNRLVHGVIPVPEKPFKIPLYVKTSPAAAPHKGELIASCFYAFPQVSAPAGSGPCNGQPGAPHSNPATNAGFVAATAEVAPSVTVQKGAQVCGSARVSGSAQILDRAQVSGNAVVKGSAIIKNWAEVYGNAEVSGSAKVEGNAEVYGSAKIYSSAKIAGAVHVYDEARVGKGVGLYGRARIFNEAKVYTGPSSSGEIIYIADEALIYGSAQVNPVYGGAFIRGHAHVFGEASVGGVSSSDSNRTVYILDWARVSGKAKIRKGGGVTGRARVNGYATIEGEMRNNARACHYTRVPRGTTVSGNAHIKISGALPSGTITASRPAGAVCPGG